MIDVSYVDEILVTRTRQVEKEVLSSLQQLHVCLSQNCLSRCQGEVLQ